MNLDLEIELRVTTDYGLAQEWELVLLSQGLSPRLRQCPEGFVLSVPQGEVNRARAGLLAYENENSDKLAERSAPPSAPRSLAVSTMAGILILVFYSVTVFWMADEPWFERGSADAFRILHGEPRRAVTALTLHADVVHALSNAVGITLFLIALSTTLGVGVSCALVLLSGASGNFANAYFHGDPYVSLGASTAVFGAVGMLAALAVARRLRTISSRRRLWMPIAAAFALLGMLGTGGQRVDVWAHLFGMLAGGVLGTLVTFVAPRAPGLAIQWACGGAGIAALAYCWVLALR